MQITKITNKQESFTIPKKTYLTPEALQREFDYYMAEKVLQKMLGQGLITKKEFNKIMLLNRETFSPMLAQIMPDIP